MSERDARLKELTDIVEKHVESLMKHFDNIQIIGGIYDRASDSTEHLAVGGGNHYARIGQVWEWLIVEDESIRERVRKAIARDNADEEDEDEEDEDEEEC